VKCSKIDIKLFDYKLTFLHGCIREQHESGCAAASMETMMETEQEHRLAARQ